MPSDQHLALSFFQRKLHECILQEVGARWNEDDRAWVWPSEAFTHGFGKPESSVDSSLGVGAGEGWICCGDASLRLRAPRAQTQVVAEVARILHTSLGAGAYHELCAQQEEAPEPSGLEVIENCLEDQGGEEE